MIVKTRIATTTSPEPNDADPIEIPAAIHIIRFFGLIAARAKPKPRPLTAVMSSMACIHFGVSCSPPRPRHCFTPNARSNTPNASLIHDTVADGSPSESPSLLDRSTKITVATTIPSIQPSANPTLVLPARLDNNIKIAAMIGIGDTATPTARGNRSPMTDPMPTSSLSRSTLGVATLRSLTQKG